jgi:hypothetical protein
MFDTSKYANGFNSGDFMTYLNQAALQFNVQFSSCKTTEFLFSLDNRLSDDAFLSGLIANLSTQVGTYVGYIAASMYVTDPTIQPIFLKLKSSSPLDQIYTYLASFYTSYMAGTTVSFKDLGLKLTQFLLSFVNFKSPNVKANNSTK